MACKTIGHSSEEIRNIITNKGFLWDISKDDTFEVLSERNDYANRVTVKPTETNQHYIVLGNPLKERVSNIRQKAYKGRVGKSEFEKEQAKPDFIKFRHAGTKAHTIAQELMEKLYNGKGDIYDIGRRAAQGEFSLDDVQLQEVKNVVQEHIDEINRIQKSIDPTKKARVWTEQVLLSPRRNIGGAADVFVGFSDKTYGIIDYKTVHPTPQNFVDGGLINDLMGLQKVGDYELSMNEYGKIAREDFGWGEARLSRLSPILLRLEGKPFKEQREYDVYTTRVKTVQAGSKRSPYLKPIPVGERTPYGGINEMLKKQYSLMHSINKRVSDKTLSKTDRDIAERQVKSIRKAIQSTLIDGDIGDMLTSVRLIMEEVQSKVKETPTLSSGEKNYKFMSDDDLTDAIGELSMYKDIIENTHKYYGDLQVSNPTKYNELKSKIATTQSNVLSILTLAREHYEQRALAKIEAKYKDDKGNLLPWHELPFAVRNATDFSNINHWAFKTTWEIFQHANYQKKQDIMKVVDDMSKADKQLFEWAKSKGMKRQEAFNLLIDFDKGLLHSELSKELLEKIAKARSNPDTESASKQLKDIYKIKDIKTFEKSYNDRLQAYKERQISRYEGGEASAQYQRDISSWITLNDLQTSKSAWTNRYNRYWLEIKPEVKKANINSDYARIMKDKALADYYSIYTKWNDTFRDILGVADYSELPPNFVANIRKGMIDHLALDTLHPKLATKEFFDSLHIREEDNWLGDTDSNGELHRTIPLLFTNPLRNVDGEIDMTQKSYDLTKSMIAFASMAYNNKYMHEIEPTVLQFRQLLNNPTSEQGKVIVTSRSGKGLIGPLNEVMTKVGADTDTARLYTELTDFYLYGTRFKERDIQTGKWDAVKALMKAKQYYGKSTLAFAVIPGAGAYTAGVVASFFEGTKGISYTRGNMLEASKDMILDNKKYMATGVFFDLFAADPIRHIIERSSSSLIERIFTERTMMYPLIKPDELRSTHIGVSMTKNWGIDTEGKLGKKNALVRLNDPSRDTTGIKRLWDQMHYDEKTGKMSYEGFTEDNFIAFRNAAKEVSRGVFGSLSQEDINRADTNLMYNLMFQFKNWMPGIVRERTGELMYDSTLQAARWGRYRAAFSEFGITDTDFENGFKLVQYMSKIFLPNVAKFTLDLATFGISPKLGLRTRGGTYIDSRGNTRKTRTNPDRAYRIYLKYITENPGVSKEDMTFDRFLEIKEAQMRAFVNEARAIILFASAIHMMGLSGSGSGSQKEPPPYMANWFSRFAYKGLTKAQSELTFIWDPRQLSQLIKNPIPLTSLFTRTINTVMNGFDETRDLLGGENKLSDRTPMGYYTLQWFYGTGQIARLTELYKQYEKSPYLVVTGY